MQGTITEGIADSQRNYKKKKNKIEIKIFIHKSNNFLNKNKTTTKIYLNKLLKT